MFKEDTKFSHLPLCFVSSLELYLQIVCVVHSDLPVSLYECLSEGFKLTYSFNLVDTLRRKFSDYRTNC